MVAANNRFGVLLFDEGWHELGEALEPYVQHGPIGKYLYCRKLEVTGALAELTFTPEQVGHRIDEEMTVWIPTSFIKFVATSSKSNERGLGFV
ncbi:hypothetical protein [Aquisalimonas sp.]|uniref:hypothetical protein n=1 Tax=Aquisalimonas sp. TaxID=1872621 RepID=UPI0025C079DB|nr:hypothetical protein [Aquisalimonas sp.]